MGNTLGALVFLAAGGWLGYKVLTGQASQFLAAMHSSNPSSQQPATPGTGGAGNVSPIELASAAITPNVFGNAFGHASSTNAPGSDPVMVA